MPATDEAYQEALTRIEKARREGSTSLGLSGLGLDSLPPEIWQLTHLTELILYENQLTTYHRKSATSQI